MPVGDSRFSGPAPGGRGPSLRWATTSFGIAVLVAVAYFLAALISYAFKFEPSGVVVIWAPAGVMLALLVLMPYRSWPAAAIGGFAGNFLADFVSGHLVVISLAGATANILESVLAAWLVVHFCRRPVHLRTLRDVLGLVVLAAGLANAVTALLGAAVLVVGSTFTFAGGWFAWWIGDGVGMLVVAPLILAWTGVAQAPPKLRWPRLVEGAVLLGALLLVAVLVIRTESGAERILHPSPYMTFPLLLWAALRFGPAGAATATFAVAAVIAEQASRGLGAFVIAGTRPDQQVVEAYVYLVLAASTALIPAAVLAERTRLTRQLRKNEEQYRQLFERNPHPMWIFDPGTLAFLAVNDAAVAQYGYDREEFASRTIRDIRPTVSIFWECTSCSCSRRRSVTSRAATTFARRPCQSISWEVISTSKTVPSFFRCRQVPAMSRPW